MRLTQISENVNRRDFMKMLGITMTIPSMTQDVATQIVKRVIRGGCFQLRVDHWEYDADFVSLEDEWNDFFQKYQLVRKLTKSDRIYIMPNGEELSIVTNLDATRALKIASKYKMGFESEDGGYFFEAEDFSIVTPNNNWCDFLATKQEDALTPSNLLKMWWDKYGSNSAYSYMNENMANLLKQHGLNPLRANIKDFEGSDGYNTTETRKKHTGSSDPEPWELRGPVADNYDEFLKSQMAYEGGIGESRHIRKHGNGQS